MEVVHAILEKAESSKAPELKPFTTEVIEGFKRLGNDQRGKPEAAMIKVQFALGGGVLNPLVEHVGDLTHRMTDHVRWMKSGDLPTASTLGYSTTMDKVEKTLKWLRSGYGFARELENNIRNNAEHRKQNIEDFRKQLDTALQIYAREHSKLVVWNQMQWLARGAAIAVGNKAWESAEDYLQAMKVMGRSEDSYVKWAGDFTLDRQGNLVAKR